MSTEADEFDRIAEAVAEHLHEERGYDHQWTWPTHPKDDGYRGDGGYVAITPPDVQVRLREEAARILTRVDQLRRLSVGDPVQATLEEALTPGDRTDDLVDRFAVALKAKLRQSEDKRGWKDGQPSAWRHADWQERCQVALAHHVWKGDPIDVAAFAAFCWHHGWPTYAPRVHGDRKTESVVPTAAGEAAYQARYPGAPLGDCEDWAVDAWNRVAAAALSVSIPTGEGEERSGCSKWGASFPPSSCNAFEDCAHDGVCHDFDRCQIKGPAEPDDEDDANDAAALAHPQQGGEREAVARTIRKAISADGPCWLDASIAGAIIAEHIAPLRTENETLRAERDAAIVRAEEAERKIQLYRQIAPERIAEMVEEYGAYNATCKLGKVYGTATIGEFVSALLATAKLAQAEGEIATMLSVAIEWRRARLAACAAPIGTPSVWTELGSAETALSEAIRALTTTEHPHGD